MEGKAKAYFLVQGWVVGSKMAILGRTYFMDGPLHNRWISFEIQEQEKISLKYH